MDTTQMILIGLVITMVYILLQISQQTHQIPQMSQIPQTYQISQPPQIPPKLYILPSMTNDIPIWRQGNINKGPMRGAGHMRRRRRGSRRFYV
jgi:hypothetical protein